jgi:hypothetical protein
LRAEMVPGENETCARVRFVTRGVLVRRRRSSPALRTSQIRVSEEYLQCFDKEG